MSPQLCDGIKNITPSAVLWLVGLGYPKLHGLIFFPAHFPQWTSVFCSNFRHEFIPFLIFLDPTRFPDTFGLPFPMVYPWFSYGFPRLLITGHLAAEPLNRHGPPGSHRLCGVPSVQSFGGWWRQPAGNSPARSTSPVPGHGRLFWITLVDYTWTCTYLNTTTHMCIYNHIYM